MRPIRWILALAILVAGALWFVTRAERLDAAEFAALEGDAEAGREVFFAAGCAGCHVAPDTRVQDAPVLAGGQRFETAFGTFVAPNISPGEEAGIGGWSDAEIAQSILTGTSPRGAHYYPAFPYATYARARHQDIADLIAYWRTLPADATPSAASDIPFPYNIRRGIGLWKALFMSDDWVVAGDLTEEQARGRYLVEALGHCGECHTPRNALGAPDTGNWLAGGPDPSGDGSIPNITPAELDWSEFEIAEYLKSGFTPTFDSAGGSMAEVIDSTSRLADADREAIAAYLKAVPPVPDAD